MRKEFVNLMKIKNNLTSKEKNSLNTCSAVLDIAPHIGAQQAVNTYPDYILGKITMSEPDDEKKKKSYRTKSKADNTTDNLPSNLAIITNDKYKDSLSLQQNGGAYLQPLATTD